MGEDAEDIANIWAVRSRYLVRCGGGAPSGGAGIVTDRQNALDSESQSVATARDWCAQKGDGWSVVGPLGDGGTASVVEVQSPKGPLALKLYTASFSAGEKGKVEQRRIEQQLALRDHDCPSLVQVYEGGTFNDQLYLVMSRAPGRELEKRLHEVPRDKIRRIVDQVARAVMFLQSKGLCHRDIKASNVFISEDFNHATLLDISVIREIYDPIGVGTDHDGQLPVVATARYSPPEYLFRLLEPSPDLWHALSVYQLGALLHDLIVRQPLFQKDYEQSALNRYRFAWIVATVDPFIEANDVDQDLVLIARRALDKDWQRRSSLRLDDFLADAGVEQKHALELFGLVGDPAVPNAPDNIAARLERLRSSANVLEHELLQALRRKGVTATHQVTPGSNDTSKHIIFQWNVSRSSSATNVKSMELCLTLHYLVRDQKDAFTATVDLCAETDAEKRTASLDLPIAPDETGVEAALAAQVEVALGALAAQLARAKADN